MPFYIYGKNICQKDITQIVDTRTERSINLEFRSGDELSLTNQKKINKLAITVAAFANTIGGTLIYGIDTKRNKANSLSFVNSNLIIESGIKNILNFKIHRSISDLQIIPVVFNNENNKTVYVIKIPQSNDAPHISFDNKYYKRHKFSNVVMEEHEIRMLYKKSGVSEIDFFALLNTNGVPSLEDGKIIVINFYPRFLIKNVSSVIEHSYKIEISLPTSIYDTSFTALQEYFVRFDGINSVFSIPNRNPIFQEEITNVLETKLFVNHENFETFANNKLNLRLFYTNGMKAHSFNLIDTFIYKNKQLQISDFHR